MVRVMRLQRALIVGVVGATAVSGVAAGRLHLGDRVGTGGLGPIKIGSTIAEAERAAGRDFHVSYFPESDCGGMRIAKGVTALITGQTVARIDVRSRSYPSGKGVRRGDRVSTLLTRYSKLRKGREFYTGQPMYILRRGNRKLLFFTNGERVTQISTGRIPEIDYVEGCA
jgi:hypothetical protein